MAVIAEWEITAYTSNYEYDTWLGITGIRMLSRREIRSITYSTTITDDDAGFNVQAYHNPGGLGAPWMAESISYSKEQGAPLTRRFSETWAYRGEWQDLGPWKEGQR